MSKKDEKQEALAEQLPQGIPFEAGFFQHVLLEHIKLIVEKQPELVPVVELHLSDGGTLDVCRFVAFTPAWLAIFYARDVKVCDDTDLAFVPYSMITRVSVSLHGRSTRRLGFDLDSTMEESVPSGVTPAALG